MITQCSPLFLLLLLVSAYVIGVQSVGVVPDARNEGLVHRFSTYKDVALFRFTLPSELSKATFEFAGFQNHPECPSIWITTCIQHGAYPVVNPDNGTFAPNYYLQRSQLDCIRTPSSYEPHSNSLYPVFNPTPGPWYTVSYISPDTPSQSKLSELIRKCRYSIGSVGIWNKVDNLAFLAHGKQTVKTVSRYSYFKILIPNSIPHFKIQLSNCQSLAKDISRPWFKEESCIEVAALRGRALPFAYESSKDQITLYNISTSNNALIEEPRPFKADVYYYVLLVTNGKISVDLNVEYGDCGEPGLYGEAQRNWFLEEKGLVWKANQTSGFREPEAGFTLFNFPEADPNDHFLQKGTTNPPKKDCVSRFELTRIDDGRDFYATFLLQGRRWYTKWITVRSAQTVLTRFDIRESMDTGATLLIRLQAEMSSISSKKNSTFLIICLSHNREPLMNGFRGQLNCDDAEKTILSVDESHGSIYVPFPEYGPWFLGAQIIHAESSVRESTVMMSMDVRLQPCGYRLENGQNGSDNLCGQNGLCYHANDGLLHFSSCKCFSGHRGWTCDDEQLADSSFQKLLTTLLLTLSNLAFLPAVFLALYYRLWTMSLAYFTTMGFSTFYHMCDEEAQEKSLPRSMDSLCNNLYVNNEVLQFCDFYSATLSFWITIIALSKFSPKLVSFLNTLGVILIAVLVQYNRTGAQVFAIPIPIGLALLLLSLVLRGRSRGKAFRPNPRCLYFLLPGISSTLFALALFIFFETYDTYAYVHSAWHIFIGISLLFFVPLCKETKDKNYILSVGSVISPCITEDDNNTQISTISGLNTTL